MAPQKSMRYFLGSCTASPVTNPLINMIQQANPENLILGTAHPTIKNTISPQCYLIDPTNIKIFQQLLFDSDIIIYDLSTCDLRELEFAIQQLKTTSSEKHLICISSVMAWSDTPPKEKQEQEEAELMDEESEAEEEQKENEQEVDKKTFVKFTEQDYALRKALPEFEYLISYETLCLSASVSQPTLKSYVLCSGILYGDEQFSLYQHFKQAWLQKYVSSKKQNRIPMIHVQDLAQFVFKIPERPPQNKYIFAVDQNKKTKQKHIFESIFKGSSQENTITIPETSDLLIDLRMLSSKVFDIEETEEVQEDTEEEQKEVVKQFFKSRFSFNWHCKEGLIANISKLKEEFNIRNNLKANRIFIQGPAASGKTHFSELLSKFYNIPLINIQSILQMTKTLEGDLAEQVKEAVENQRNEMQTVEQERLDQLKEKNEKLGIPIVEEDYQVNPEKLNPRIPNEILYKIFKLRLQENDCLNRGYILEGFPKNFKDAQKVFMNKKQTEDGEEQLDEEEEQGDKPMKNVVLNSTISPHTFFIFEAEDQELIDKVKQFPEQKIENTHYNEEGMNRRLAQYRQTNSKESGKDTLVDFFIQNDIQTKKINVINDNVVELAKFFIERNGKFKNFMTFEEQEEDRRRQQQRQKKIYKERIEQEQVSDREIQEQEQRELAQEIYKLKFRQQEEKQEALLKSMSQPLVDYLEVNLMPFLNDGIKAVLKDHPEDPLDFLAQYLFKRSLEVKYADPKNFKN